MSFRFDRRRFLKSASAVALGAPLLGLSQRARAANGQASRLIVFYFPDGVAGPSQDGQPSLWRCAGSEHQFALSPQLEPLARHKDACVFLHGLSMGATDAGSHPGGAKKLLTGVDGGNGESIDQFLARTAGAASPHRHLYLGAMANVNGASGDKHISYVGPGQTVAPEDNPLRAFERIFGVPPPAGGGNPPTPSRDVSVIDGMLSDFASFRARLGAVERAKLDLHLESLREVEQRIKSRMEAPPMGGCDTPAAPGWTAGDGALYAPERFPELLRLQTDLMVQAMACGMSRVGVIQSSHHTSELIMSRFPGTDMSDPGFDMRSHQASHYGARHDPAHREFRDYVAQRRWFVSQFAYLLDALAARPEGDGTMLDHSLVLLATEVCDGNTHLHDDMPFVLAGRGGGAVSTGRLLDRGYTRHSNLLLALAHAMGQQIGGFGEASQGPLAGLLS